MIFSEFITEVGVHVTADAIIKISEAISKLFKTKQNPSREELEQTISAAIEITGTNISADELIQILAENGKITINKTIIHSNVEVGFFSDGVSDIKMTNTTSSTPHTQIKVQGAGAHIVLKGNASIVQTEGGGIKLTARGK